MRPFEVAEHEAETRYRNEILDDEERMVLLDRIKRLKKRFGVRAS